MANYYFYPYIALTGGGDGALDSLDGSLLKDGDGAVVIVSATQASYAYTLDEDSAADESSPDVIKPDNNAGDKRWIRVVVDCNKIATRTVASTAPNTNQLLGWSGTQWAPRSYGITFYGNLIFHGTSPSNTWADLDLSAVVGVNRAIVLLRFLCATSDIKVKFRTNGSVLDQAYDNSACGAGLNTGWCKAGYESFFIVITDTSGVVEIYTDSAQTGTDVSIMAYVRL